MILRKKYIHIELIMRFKAEEFHNNLLASYHTREDIFKKSYPLRPLLVFGDEPEVDPLLPLRHGDLDDLDRLLGEVAQHLGLEPPEEERLHDALGVRDPVLLVPPALVLVLAFLQSKINRVF